MFLTGTDDGDSEVYGRPDLSGGLENQRATYSNDLQRFLTVGRVHYKDILADGATLTDKSHCRCNFAVQLGLPVSL